MFCLALEGIIKNKLPFILDTEKDYINELTWKQKLRLELKRLLSLKNLRILLTNTLILSNAIYFTRIDIATIDLSDSLHLIMSRVLLKLVIAFFIIHWIFYNVTRFFLRIYFHVHIRQKFLKRKKQLEANGRFSLLRETHGVYKGLSFVIREYIYNLGYFTRNDLRTDVKITEEMKEEMLNDLLIDCYKWIYCLIHLVFTLFFIWEYVNFWLLVAAILAICWNFLLAYLTFPIIMNLEILNKIRLDIIKDRTLGMKMPDSK
jgi:hypothetical protein